MMNKALKNIYYILALVSILPFLVSATNGITTGVGFFVNSVSEPINMVLVGIGMIGVGGIVKSRTSSR